jgi:hypothetical protein
MKRMPDSFSCAVCGSGTSCSKDEMDKVSKGVTYGQKNLDLSNVHAGVGCDSCGVCTSCRNCRSSEPCRYLVKHPSSGLSLAVEPLLVDKTGFFFSQFPNDFLSFVS